MHPRLIAALASALVFGAVFGAASVAAAQSSLPLANYRAAETARDGFALSRPVGLGHVGFGARLDLDYGLESLTLGGNVNVDHHLSGQLGLALGLFERFVVSVRLPVTLVMEGQAVAGAPTPTGAGLGDLALSARWIFFGEESDVFSVGLQLESTLPTARAADPSQQLVGESGVSFSPEAIAELRFLPVRIQANLGLRFREAAAFAQLQVQHEMTWGLGVSVDVVENFFDLSLEGYGATALDRFGASAVSPVEAILGARVRPVDGMVVGLAGGLGIGDGYGTPAFRAVLTLGWADELVAAPPRIEREEDAVGQAADPVHHAGSSGAAPVAPSGNGGASGASDPGPRPGAEASALPYGQLDRDGDRLVDAEDQCPLDREDHDEIADDDGCPEEDADGDAVADLTDMCPLTPGVANEDASCNGCPERACVSSEGQIVITDRVEFATGSDQILERSEPVLQDVLSIIQSNEQIQRVRIEGHTDDRGSDRRNVRLSRERAASVRRWLVEHGLDASRLEGWGCGEAHPIEENRTRRGRQTNRRVEFHITDPPTAGYTPREGCQEAETE